MTGERLTYRFGPVERRGLLGQLRAGQAAVVAAGAIAAILAIDQAPSAAGAFLAVLGLGLAVALAFAPVGRRTAEEWAPIALAFGSRRLRGRHRFRSPMPAEGMLATEEKHRRRFRQSEPHPPAVVRGVRIIEVPYRGRTIGVLTEQRRRRLTAVLGCRVLAFSLLDPEAQERRLARWGLILSGAAGGAIRRIQWLERTVPAQGDELARWLHDERDPAVPLRGTPMIESYLELIGATTRAAHEHEILIAVQVDPRRGGERGRDAGLATLIEQTERVAEGLAAAEVSVLGALGSGQLARVLRTAFDPYARAELTALEAADPSRQGLSEANAWPLGAHEHWEHYRSDGALHATFWIGQWPRVDVSPMFMDALLGRSSVVRTVAVTFEPVAPVDLSADFTRLGEQVREAEAGGAQRIQVDVMDGHFVPNITMGPMVVAAVRRSTSLPIEAHLMITNPQEFIEDFAQAGADVIIVHQEVCPHLHRVIQQIKATGKSPAVALNPSTPIILLENILSLIDMVLIMTVNPGFGGQAFIPEMLPKIARLRQVITQRGLHCDIEVDGGIHEATAPQVVKAGANLLVAGSAVYNEKESVAQAIARLKNAVSEQ